MRRLNSKPGFRISVVTGSVIVAVGLSLSSTPSDAIGADNDALWKPFLTEGDFHKLIESEAKAAQDELAKPKPDAKKIRGSAILIALAAINLKDGGDAKQAASIRDAAFKLAEASSKTAEAKKLADALAHYKEMRAEANPGTVDLRKEIDDLKDAMDIFGLPTKGGEGIEKEYLILGQQRKPFSPAQLSDKVVLMAYKSALIASVARAHEDQGEKKKKEWLRLTDEMRQTSLEFADAVKAKKPKEAKTALNKLSASCNDCHAAFRDK